MGGTRLGGAGRLALLLLLLNVIVVASFLALRAWESSMGGTPRELHGDRVRLLSPDGVQSTSAARAPESAPTPALQPGSATDKPEVAAPQVAGPACFKVDLAAGDAFQRLRHALDAQGIKDYTLQVDGRLNWWVYWPPVSDPVAQVKAVSAISKAGVKDMAVVRQGSMTHAISLGVFATQEAARRHWQKLRSAGLDKIEYAPRPTVAAAVLVLPALPADKLDGLKTTLKAGPSLTGQACPAQTPARQGGRR